MPKLLIVDDEPDVCGFAKNFFKKFGIDVITAGSGQEALDLLKTEVPDLVLLDIRMKDMSGVEVLREIRQRRIFTRVIMLSALDNEEISKEVNALGVVTFIHKPLILEEFEKIVLTQLSLIPVV